MKLQTKCNNYEKRPQQPESKRNPIEGQHSGTGADKQWMPPDKFRTISLKSIAELLDTTRSSARRWLKEAGIRPIALGRGAKGAIRYRWKDVEAYLRTREYVE